MFTMGKMVRKLLQEIKMWNLPLQIAWIAMKLLMNCQVKYQKSIILLSDLMFNLTKILFLKINNLNN